MIVKTKTMTILRLAPSIFVSAMIFCPVAANAHTSDGSDGSFLPTVNTTLDASRPVFNFTDFYIPAGVTVDFSGLAASQPIELLATGDINIVGTLDGGANSLWIETPGNITLSGTLSGYRLTLASGSSITINGTINTSGGGSPTSGGIIGGGLVISNGDNSPLAIPEPQTWLMFAMGLLTLFAAARLHKSKWLFCQTATVGR